jgi:hypothetical protein
MRMRTQQFVVSVAAQRGRCWSDGRGRAAVTPAPSLPPLARRYAAARAGGPRRAPGDTRRHALRRLARGGAPPAATALPPGALQVPMRHESPSHRVAQCGNMHGGSPRQHTHRGVEGLCQSCRALRAGGSRTFRSAAAAGRRPSRKPRGSRRRRKAPPTLRRSPHPSPRKASTRAAHAGGPGGGGGE